MLELPRKFMMIDREGGAWIVKPMKETKKSQGMVSKTMEKSLLTIADIFAALPCSGPWYEVKVPKKLQK